MITFFLSLIMCSKKNKIRGKGRLKLLGNRLLYRFTDLSTDVGVVHNHFESDERGCCWINNDPEEEMCFLDFESKSVISISESMKTND
jgi:hypothetical protein